MPQVPPKKPQPKKHAGKLTTGHHRRPVEEETAGKIYLVRDKDYGDGDVELWGKELPWADACILKETVAARGKSRTVRVEEQTPDSPYAQLAVSKRSPLYRPDLTGEPTSEDPEIAAAQKAALAAARPVAAAAQVRAAAPKKIVIPPAALVPPPPMPELPAELEGEDLPAGMDPDELHEIFGDPTDEELQAAAETAAKVLGGDTAAAPFNALEQAMHWPCTKCNAMPGVNCTDPAGPITHSERVQAAILAGPVPPPVDIAGA